jgi:hypothetical protein
MLASVSDPRYLEADPDAPDQWMHAGTARRLVIEQTLSAMANLDLAKRAHAGLLRTRADSFFVDAKGDLTFDDRSVGCGSVVITS